MHNPLMLEGEVVPNQEGRVIELEMEIDGLRAELANVQRQLIDSRRDAARSVAKLRQVLKPQFDALRMLFGEMDAVVGDDAAAEPLSSPKRAAWELWKQKLPGYPAKFIDALLAHGDLDSRQLSITTGCHYTNVAKVIYKLNQAGLVNKNGNRFSLKEL